MEDIESGHLSYTIVKEFLLNLKEEFGSEDNETIKIEQKNKTMEEFV